MVPALVVLAVAVLVLAAWLWASRTALGATRVQVSELETRTDALTHENEATTARLEVERARAEDAAARADRERQRAADAEQRADASDRAAMDAATRLAELKQRDDDRLDAMQLWALETVRFDRLWRDQVAQPDAASPFLDTIDPARSAIEIMAAALREESGTSIEVVWKLRVPPTPGPAARLVRAAEELLALSRSVDHGTLEVTDDDDALLLRLEAQPALSLPPHILAAIDAAGLQPVSDATGSGVRVSAPDDDHGPGGDEPPPVASDGDAAEAGS